MTDLDIYLGGLRGDLAERDDGPPESIRAAAKAYKQVLMQDNDRTRVSIYHGPDGWTTSTMFPSYPSFFVTDDGKLYVRRTKKPPGRKKMLRGPVSKAVEGYLADNFI